MNTAHWHRRRGCIYVQIDRNWTHKLDILLTQQADRTTQALIRLLRIVYIPRLNLSLPHTTTSLAGSRRYLVFATAELNLNSEASASKSNKVEECNGALKALKEGVLQSWIPKRQADKNKRKKRKRRHI